jgi:glycosyltransferase 2 family protein
MRKIVFNTLKYLGFFAVGVSIFWLLYRKIDWKEMVGALRDLNYFWIAASIFFGLMSQVSRSFRWKMLIKPMGYNPKFSNTFLSVLILYFVNLIIPRAGEVARCTVLNRTDKVPFTKLVGTVFVERLADTIMLFFLAIIIFAMNFSVVIEFFKQHPAIAVNLQKFISVKYLVIFVAILIFIVFCLIALKNNLKKSKKKGKLVAIRDQFIDGIKSIAGMERKWLFIGHTLFIFLMWLLMLYVVFLAYAPTQQLSIRSGMVVFLMGGLAMLAPIQGGIGPWHFMVAETLLLYGITRDQALIFALVAHTSTNLIYILFGGVALLIVLASYESAGKQRLASETVKL